MNRCASITRSVIVSHNICIRGFQLWLYWQGLNSLWNFGLDGWLLGLIFATAYFMIGNCIEGLMMPVPTELGNASQRLGRLGGRRTR